MSLAELIPFRARAPEPCLSLTDDFELESGMGEEMAKDFPPLSPIQLELQEIENKRENLNLLIAESEIEISSREIEIARLASLNEQRRMILAGLGQHERVLTDKGEPEKDCPAPVKAKAKKPAALDALPE